jgi:hypothetical protein
MEKLLKLLIDEENLKDFTGVQFNIVKCIIKQQNRIIDKLNDLEENFDKQVIDIIKGTKLYHVGIGKTIKEALESESIR